MDVKLKAGQKKCSNCFAANPIRIFACKNCNHKFNDQKLKSKKLVSQSIKSFIEKKSKLELSLDMVLSSGAIDSNLIKILKINGSSSLREKSTKLAFTTSKSSIYSLLLVNEDIYIEKSSISLELEDLFRLKVDPVEKIYKMLIECRQSYLFITINNLFLTIKLSDDLQVVDSFQLCSQNSYTDIIYIDCFALKLIENSIFLVVADSEYKIHLYRCFKNRAAGFVYQSTYAGFFFFKIVSLVFIECVPLNSANQFFAAASLDSNMCIFSVFDNLAEQFRYKVNEVWITKMAFCPEQELLLMSVEYPEAMYCLKFSNKQMKLKRLNGVNNVVDFEVINGNLVFLTQEGEVKMIDNKIMRIFSGINKSKPEMREILKREGEEIKTVYSSQKLGIIVRKGTELFVKQF